MKKNKKSGLLKKIESIPKFLKVLGSLFVAFSIAGFLLFVVLSDYEKGTKIYLSSFDMSPSLEEDGYTGEIISRKIQDINKDIRESVKHNREKGLLEGDEIEGSFEVNWLDEKENIEIPGIVSTGSLVNFIRKIRGDKTFYISGEVVKLNDKIESVLRVNGTNVYSKRASVDNMEDIFLSLAEKVSFYTQPYHLIIFLYMNRENDECVKVIKDIIEEEKENTKSLAYTVWGNIEFQKGDYEESIEKQKKALEIKPSNSSAYQGWGLVLMQKKKYDEAIKKFKKAIEVNPNSSSAYIDWGHALSEQGKYDEAIEKFKKVIESKYLESEKYYAYVYWAFALEKQEKYKEADDKFRETIETDPSYSDGYIHWGTSLKNRGLYEDAIRNYKKAWELDGKDVYVLVEWADALSKQNRIIEALEKYKEASIINPGYARTYTKWGLSLHEYKKYDEAIEKYQKSLELESAELDWAYLFYGMALEKKGEYVEAVKKYNKVIELNPESESAKQAMEFIKNIEG